MGKFNLDVFYEITAACNFNPERRKLLQPLIKTVFNEEVDSFDIHKDTIKDSIYETVKLKSRTYGIEQIFKEHNFLITSGVDFINVIEYLNLRYHHYKDVFLKTYHLPLESFIYISYVISEIYVNKINQNPYFKDYEFTRKEDYCNLNFFAVPDKIYIDTWKNVSTIDFNDLLEKIVPFSREHLNIYLKLNSFDIKKITVEPDLRFHEYPLFYYNDKIIIIYPDVLFTYLPYKIDILLNKTKSYQTTKGKIFENIVLDLIEEIPVKKNVYRNIKYNGFELDGLLNLKRSSWFIECKSRNLSSESLKGNKKKIQKDVERAIEDAIRQGERDIQYKDSEEMKKYNIKNIFGVIVIVEGIFPNLRTKKLLPDNPVDKCKYPVCIFNYFDLRTIVNQHDANLFEDFLIWRSQKDMPIYAFDECDYWDFYTKMKQDKERKRIFKLAQKNKNTVFYNGDRFNDKRYISNIEEFR